MAKRLMSLRQIQAEKFPRGRTKIKEMVAAGEFPKPAVKGSGNGSDLWEEEAIDRFLERFIAAEKAKAGQATDQVMERARRATAARLERRTT